jgi:hypothetical protein
VLSERHGPGVQGQMLDVTITVEVPENGPAFNFGDRRP